MITALADTGAAAAPTAIHRRSNTTTSPGATSPPVHPRPRESLVAQPTERLEADLYDLAHRLSVGTYELLVLIGELDHRGSWAAFGALSCASWLADTCDIEISTARSQVRVARTMREIPALERSMASGDVSYAKARALAAYLTDENADALIDIAVRTPASRVGAEVAAWSQRNDDPAEIAARQHESRSVSWRTEADGCVVMTARLTPEAAGELCAVVDAHVTRADAPAGASLAQQRADALHTIVTASPSAGGPGGSGGSGASAVTAEVVVHVTADGNRLTDGTPLSDHAVAGLLPRSFVSLLLHDLERRPIDASPRRRTPTRRQRRVIDELHPECAHPGCSATAFLQYDHILPYAEGGPTTLSNLQRLCGPHNRERQPGGYGSPQAQAHPGEGSGVAWVRRGHEEAR